MVLENQYLLDHLFLLVGNNPLPNYVAVRLLLHTPSESHVYLFHSKDTTPERDALTSLLQKHGVENIYPHEIEEANPQQIRNKLSNVATKIQGTVGLNYTGGTKAMAVHAYSALQSRQGVLYSYLDARTLTMLIEDHQGKVIQRVHNAPQRVAVPVEDLLLLHNLSDLRQGMSTTTVWDAIADALADLHSDKQSNSDWRQWCENTLRRKEQRHKFLSEGDMKKVPLEMKGCEQIEQLLQQQSQVNAESTTLADLQASGEFKKVQDVAKWFDGEWFEQYVFRQLKPLQPEVLSDLQMTINPKLGQAADFEFDIAAMRGYQLFALSVTTSDEKKLCKSKLLEAVIRAEQLGGSEAQVALVSCYDEPTALEKELHLLRRGKVRVFGREHLGNLRNELETWIRSASHERYEGR